MTIKEAYKKLRAEIRGSIYAIVFDIDFTNSEGEVDETQFTASCFKNAEKELSKLFSDFCKENGYKKDSVLSITWVNS